MQYDTVHHHGNMACQLSTTNWKGSLSSELSMSGSRMHAKCGHCCSLHTEVDLSHAAPARLRILHTCGIQGGDSRSGVAPIVHLVPP